MSELLFVTAQPDVPYFHWQCEIYGYNFVEKGIKPSQIHIIFGIINGAIEPSEGALKLKEKGYNVHFYSDDRVKKYYIPSVKPFLISKWLKEFPEYGKVFFLHDADIIFRELPNLNKYLKDDICYLADTKGYIGYDYIMDVCKRYEKEHQTSKINQLIYEMTNVVGISIECAKCNQENSGGGQYIIKNTTHEDWYKIYEDSDKLYDQMHAYHKRFPISPGEIQFWTAEMWSVLWNLWRLGKETRIVEDLNFSWATDGVDIYEKRPILHMAGIVDSMKTTKFYKGEFINENPLDKLKTDENYFNYVDKNNSTIKYVEVMKSLVKKTNN
jgi:hypothetical protein